MYSYYNPNPRSRSAGDCTVRAIARATGRDWETTYWQLAAQGCLDGEMPSANSVWGNYLRRLGFRRQIVPDTCPECYTVADFAAEHPTGTYILALSGHVVCVEDGDWCDSWDSGAETVIYFWVGEDDHAV